MRRMARSRPLRSSPGPIAAANDAANVELIGVPVGIDDLEVQDFNVVAAGGEAYCAEPSFPPPDLDRVPVPTAERDLLASELNPVPVAVPVAPLRPTGANQVWSYDLTQIASASTFAFANVTGAHAHRHHKITSRMLSVKTRIVAAGELVLAGRKVPAEITRPCCTTCSTTMAPPILASSSSTCDGCNRYQGP
jgi:hypothetical protein